MSKTIFLHIGYPKTGSTSIQRFFVDNHEKLKENGFLYPQTGLQSFGHHILAKYYYKLAAEWIEDVDKEVAYDALTKEIRDWGGNNVVLSSEVYVQGQDVKQLKVDLDSYLGDFEVKIIVYLRRQDRWYGSLYNQITKTGNNTLFPVDFIERRMEHNNYFEILEPWSKLFGKDQITVIPFERAQWKNGSLEHEFLKQVNIEDDDYIFPQVANTRINRDCLEYLILTYPNEKRIGPYFRRLIKILERYSVANSDLAVHKEIFSPKQRMKIYSFYKDSNAQIAKKYLNRPDGVLFYENPPDQSENWLPYPGLTNKKLLSIHRFIMDEFIFKKNIIQKEE